MEGCSRLSHFTFVQLFSVKVFTVLWQTLSKPRVKGVNRDVRLTIEGVGQHFLTAGLAIVLSSSHKRRVPP